MKIEEILNLSDAEYEKLFNGTINFEIAEKVSEVCCNFSDDQKYKIAEDSFQKSLKDTQKKYLIDYKKILSWRDKMFGTKEEIQRSHDQKIVQWWIEQDYRTAKLSVIMEKAKELLVARNIKITNVWWQKFIQRNTQEIEKNHLRIEQ